MTPHQRHIIDLLLSDLRKYRLNEWEEVWLGKLLDRDAALPLRAWQAAQLRCTWTTVTGQGWPVQTVAEAEQAVTA